MKKKLLSFLLGVLMLTSAVTAVRGAVYTERQMRIADALYSLDLFRGTNLGYELGRELTRAEGITLLVRLLGEEETAVREKNTTPFTDVDPWAMDYVGYAYRYGITKGTSPTEFEPDETMTDYMFITLTLRALGYSDSGDAPQFVWDAPYALAKTAGLIATASADRFFTRGDAVEVFWNALSFNDYSVAYSLMDKGAFTSEELEEAIEIYLNGKKEGVETPDYGDGSETEDTAGDDPVYDDETGKPNGTDKPSETGKPAETGKPTETDKPAETGKPAETDKPTETGKPAETDKPAETGKPAETDKPAETGKPAETDKPAETGKPAETDKPADTDKPAVPDGDMTYEKYMAMSGEEQQVFFETFATPADFFAWLTKAQADYKAEHPDIEIDGDGSIDLGDLIG